METGLLRNPFPERGDFFLLDSPGEPLLHVVDLVALRELDFVVLLLEVDLLADLGVLGLRQGPLPESPR